MRIICTIYFLIISLVSISQLIVTNTKLIITHNDIVLYLTKDTNTFISKHTLKYENFLKLDSERDDDWFEDTYIGKYDKQTYYHSGFDIGHLTPSHITSYDNNLNHLSFSLFNSAPQTPKFNRGSWAKLEKLVEDTIKNLKKDVTIITGVIYLKPYNYINKIPIPTYFFKVLFIGGKKMVWIGSNEDCKIVEINLKQLNMLLRKSGENVVIK